MFINSNKTSSKIATLRHIIINCLKTKIKEKYSKPDREKLYIIIKEIII